MNKVFLLVLLPLCFGCSKSESEISDNSKILFIVSNAHYYGSSNISAANHFAEIVYAYDVLAKAGYKIDFVSPEGGAIPIGYINTSDSIQKKYLFDSDFMELLKHTKAPREVEASAYKAVYYGGGGSAMFGVAENKEIQKITMQIYEQQNGIVTAICHGTAGIVKLKTEDGRYLVTGKKVNGFPDLFENKSAEYYRHFPFSIQEAVEERGGNFRYSTEGWDDYTEVDGRLITGQDPSAAASVARHLITALGAIDTKI